MNCKHENQYLMGTSDGIVCRKCGAFFTTFAEIYPKTEEPEPVKEPAPAEKPKRTRRTKKDD